MKKDYIKPQILIEDFMFNTNLAANCEKPFNLQAQFICGIPDTSGEGTILFSLGVDGGQCNFPGDVMDGKLNDGFCYHVPQENNQLFNS